MPRVEGKVALVAGAGGGIGGAGTARGQADDLELRRRCTGWLSGRGDGAGGAATETFLRPQPLATVIGRSERPDVLSAAFLNAISANVLEFDDTYLPA
jgi:hypothetical protein